MQPHDTVDVAIIGAGISSISAAYYLATPPILDMGMLGDMCALDSGFRAVSVGPANAARQIR